MYYNPNQSFKNEYIFLSEQTGFKIYMEIWRTQRVQNNFKIESNWKTYTTWYCDLLWSYSNENKSLESV